MASAVPTQKTARKQICTCTACRALRGDASADGEFTTVAAAAASSGAAAAVFAPMAAAAAGGQRRLMQATNDDVRRVSNQVRARLWQLRVAWPTACALQFSDLPGIWTDASNPPGPSV